MRRLLFLLCFFSLAATAAPEKPPTLQLLPPTVRDDIRVTNHAAKAIESNLKAIVSRLDQQYKTYKVARCDRLTSDEECQNIERNMAQTYEELLEVLSDELPGLRASLTRMRDDLANRIRSKVGHRMTPQELQRTIDPEATPSKKLRQRHQQRGRTLSEGVRSLARLLPRFDNANSSGVSAASFYLDSVVAIETIDGIEAQIPYARTQIAMAESWGGLDDAMLEGVEGFTELYYGSPETRSVPDNYVFESRDTTKDPAVVELTNW